MTPTVAIVGRPNVGKSALFNRLAGRRIAIVHDQPGVTRDRISAEVEVLGRPFTLIDTGGIGLLSGEKTGDPIVQAAMAQVRVAIDTADLIVFVVNVREGIVPLDQEVTQQLRQSARPVVLVVNKVDHDGDEMAVAEFAGLGFPTPLPVSAIHGRGIDALSRAILAALPASAAQELPPAPGGEEPLAGEGVPEEAGALVNAVSPRRGEGGPLKLAFVGRPNVGKSSLVNALTRSERVVVSPVPGTTRDSVDVPLEITTEGRTERYLLIDTAGMRKSRRVKDSIEFYSVRRAEDSIGRADLVVFTLDAESGILEQDKKIADKIVEAHKACVVVVNKWDIYAEKVAAVRDQLQRQTKGGRLPPDAPPTTLGEFSAWVKEKLFFLSYAPVVFTSATEGLHLDRLLEAVRFVADQLRQTIPTALLNRTLQGAIERRQPLSATGSRLRFFYATQIGQAPPRFLLFVNKSELFAPTYVKYLAGELRKAFGFEGCPVLIHARARPKKVDFKSQPTRGKGPGRNARTSGPRRAGAKTRRPKPDRARPGRSRGS
ncbi:MAG: ribosome biogenesis GTPase Der [Verrucomicrobiae bacterium]|nr:ribosome biogenesis GTPase Der [Verrucomicrobiae bacterium]